MRKENLEIIILFWINTLYQGEGSLDNESKITCWILEDSFTRLCFSVVLNIWVKFSKVFLSYLWNISNSGSITFLKNLLLSQLLGAQLFKEAYTILFHICLKFLSRFILKKLELASGHRSNQAQKLSLTRYLLSPCSIYWIFIRKQAQWPRCLDLRRSVDAPNHLPYKTCGTRTYTQTLWVHQLL
jgi:hypothetical protein